MKRHILLVALLSVISFIFLTVDATHAITLSASPNPATIGQNVAVTITASLVVSVPSCNVDINFGDGSPWANAGTCNAMSPATCTLTANHTYTTPGAYTITARKNPGCTGNAFTSPDPTTSPITIKCVPLTMITTSPLPSGTVGQAYSRQIQASGGLAPITYNILSGTLPTGLSLNSSTGMISGTPAASGSYSFTVRATDNCCTGLATPVCQQVQRAFTLQINTPCPALSITTTSPLPSGTVSQAYTSQIQTSGGQLPITFSLFSGTLPPGLGLSSTGLISGTPTSSGSYSFIIIASDSCLPNGQSVQRSFTLQINPAPCPALSITSPSTLSTGTIGDGYSYQLQTTGGQAPIIFSLTSGSLPPGLILSSTGLISGTPTGMGTYNFTVTVTDSCVAGAQSLQGNFSITVNAAPCPALSIISPSTLTSGTVGQGYTYQIATSGGQAPITFSLVSGELPSGLSLGSSGLISGTPLTAGTWNFTVRATDSCATAARISKKSISDKSFSITINPAACPSLSYTSPATLSTGTVGQAYSYQLQTSGGQTPVTFSFVSGSLPPGLTLGSTGLISGMPTSSGNYSFTASATDSCAGGAQSVQGNFSITVNPASCPVLSITSPSTLSTGNVGDVYSYQLQTSGGQAPIIFSLTSGSLPPALILSSAGLISGTPTFTGTYNFTVTVTDSCATGAQSSQGNFSITVNAAPCPALSIISPSTLTSGTVGQGYTYQMATSGGQAPVIFSIVSGTLQSGLSMSASGLITGTPSSAGISTFTVRATDSCAGGAQTSDKSMTITVNPAPCPALSITSPSTLPSGTVGQSYTYQITTSGGQAPITFRFMSDIYPPGLRMNSAGLISGTPTSAGNYTFPVRATDSCAAGAQSAQNDFSITAQLIPPPVTISVNPVPSSLSIPKGFSSSNNVLYQFNGSASINTTLNSAEGNFMAGSEIIGTSSIPLTVQIHNGAGRVAEIINIPVAVIERALKRGANTFIYVRNFSDASINVTATVNFMITTEAGADFEIKRIELYFKNRRPEITVDRSFPKLRAFADIRFVGSGFLQGFWEVDGRMLSHVDQHLTYGASVTLQTPDIPPLPTFDTGSHIVRFVITNPVTDLQLPSILYFVTAEEDPWKPVNIVLLSPVNYSLIEYAPVKFEWEKLDKTPLYLIQFYGKPESAPVFSAYVKEGYYTLPDIALKGIFLPGQKYYWKVSGFDAENKVIGESETWNFTFALEKGKLQGIVGNKK